MKAYETFAKNTPLVRIGYRLDGHTGFIYAKLESFNPSGSIKDRMAAFVMGRAEESGALRPGQPIVEVTSGNTGIAFAALGALTNHPVHIFMPDWMSDERKKLLRMYGAQLHLVSRQEGGFDGALKQSLAAAGELGAFLPRQFENANNPLAHFYGTGAELLRDLPQVAGFAAGVGTGGTLMGVAQRLSGTGAVIAALEPTAAPMLAEGKVYGPHKIEGIGDDFVPAIIDRSRIHRVIGIVDDDAVFMAARLARELGLGVGISSGANFLGAVRLAQDVPGPVATVFADDNKKYLSTSLAQPVAPSPESQAARIELLSAVKVSAPEI